MSIVVDVVFELFEEFIIKFEPRYFIIMTRTRAGKHRNRGSIPIMARYIPLIENGTKPLLAGLGDLSRGSGCEASASCQSKECVGPYYQSMLFLHGIYTDSFAVSIKYRS